MNHTDKRVTVITADIVKSRRIQARRDEQERIIEVLENLNNRLQSDLVASFSLSAGDQIQAVVAAPERMPLVIRRLRAGLWPLRLHCGLGFGGINTAIHPDNPGWMDGPVFHNARKALDEAKNMTHAHTRWSGFDGLDGNLNAIYGLLDAVQSGWTSRHWEAVHIYEVLGTFELAGRQLGITGSAVYQRCAAAHWDAFRKGEDTVSEWLILLSSQP